MYFFYQKTPTSKWSVGLASDRAQLIEKHNPELASVLDVDNSFDTELTFEEIGAVKYRGPLYFDFDGGDEDMDYTIAQVQNFVAKLEGDMDVDLSMCRLYCSGGRGFHIEIPQKMFIGKPPQNGIANLPAIYKEVAFELFVQTLDMRVYSAKKGRMWRLPNVLRTNGKYKVQITPEELKGITPEMYGTLCSGPRELFQPEPAIYNAALGLVFTRASDAVTIAQKRAKQKKKSKVSLDRYNGEWPEPLEKLIKTGEGVKDGAGWNRVALQLSLTAQALGRTEDQLVQDLQPLIETYKGDSDRYGSRRKREYHIREMYRYTENNVTYEFGVSGLSSVLDSSIKLASIECEGYDPEDEEFDEEEGEEERPKTPNIVRVSTNGIWVNTEDGWKIGSHLGFKNPTRLVDEDNNDAGYEIEILVEGKSKGKKILSTQTLASKSELNRYGLTWSTAVNITDVQASAIADVLRRRTEKQNAITYVTHREGVDYVPVPTSKEKGKMTLIWISPEDVVSPEGYSYRLRSSFAKDGVYKSDLLSAPDLEDTKHMRKLIKSLLNMNTPVNIARIFGWFSACFLCQPIRYINHKKFPMLQVYGEAGAGKSETVLFFNHLHYYMNPPKEMMSAGGTNYPAIAACASSASMPVVFEEMKPAEMSKARKDFLTSLFRSSYDGHGNERGGLSKDNGSKEIVISSNELRGPVVFCGESLEDQTAIVERCVIVPLSKYNRHGRSVHHAYLKDHTHDLGIVGKHLALSALTMNIDELRTSLRDNFKLVMDNLKGKGEEASRPAMAMAVTLVGLEFAQTRLNKVFNGAFDEKFEELRNALFNNTESLIPSNKSELCKTLDVMAQLSRSNLIEYALVKGEDYRVRDDDITELNLKQCFYKYVRYERSQGKEPFFTSDNKFINAMNNCEGVKARACPSSPLFKSPRQLIYAIKNEYLDKSENEQFEP